MQFEVELLAGDGCSQKLCFSDLSYSEEEGWSGDEDQALFEEVQPAGVGFYVCADARLTLGGTVVGTWLD